MDHRNGLRFEKMERKREVICGGAALLISAVFFVCCLRVQSLAEIISSYGNINILVYGMTLILFCLVFTAAMFLLCKFGKSNMDILEKTAVKRGLLLLLLAVQIIFFIVMVYRETDGVANVAYKYGWHTQPLIFVIVLFTVELAVFLWFYKRCMFGGKEADWIVWTVYAVLTVLILYCMYTPNIFGRGQWGDWYHAHAYFNSIYNMHWGMPYTGEITSIYGHYALFWKIPMKLIGGDFRKFVFLLAVLGAFTHLCSFFALYQLVESRLLRILGALAIVFPVLGMRGGYYWQVWPHRMVFPSIFLLYAVWILKRNKACWKAALGGYAICLLAIIWNTETGMILAAAWAGMYLSRILSEQDFTWKRLLGGIVFHGMSVVLSFLGAFGVVNLYNIMKHSPANSLSEFLIPLLSKHYMTDVLHLDIPLYPSGYMPEIVLFLIGVTMGIAGWKWFGDSAHRVSWENNFVFFLSVSALGRLVYYMNRPAYHNLDCCHLSAVILMAYLGQKALIFLKKQQWKEIAEGSFYKMIRTVISTMCVVVLLALSTGTILQFSQNSYIKENFHNEEEMNQFAQAVAAQIPPNTFAFGMNVTELYSWLHWSTQYYSIDFSDMSVASQGAIRLIDTLKEENIEQLLTTQRSLPVLEKFNPEGYQWFCETYMVDKTFPIYDEEYLYFVRK